MKTPPPSGSREVEIKLALDSPAQGRALLRHAGFRVSKRRVFEQNTLFDTAASTLRTERKGLRLRTVAKHHILTFKGAPKPGPHKDREELETPIEDRAMFELILDRLGYRPMFRYEKYRTEYTMPGSAGTAMLDETPLGVFLELEGKPAWIDGTARILGFARTAYITDSYAALQLKACRGKLRDLIFGI